MVELLLAYGADVNAVAKDPTTPFSIASKRGHAHVAELLRAAGAR